MRQKIIYIAEVVLRDARIVNFALQLGNFQRTNVFKFIGRSVMYVQSVQNYNVSMTGKVPPTKPKGIKKIINSVTQKIVDWTPSATFKDGENKVKKWENINDKISRPMENRLIMGAGAILTQPAIDYFNHRVDNETREVSTKRTIAKIIVGTLVGAFVARGPAYALVNKMTDVNGTGKWSKALLPKLNKKYLSELTENGRKLGNYKTAWASVIALGIMCFTNFLLDAPLTMWLTNKMTKKNTKEVKHE